jgi:ATP-binding cassette subfamily F protein 3
MQTSDPKKAMELHKKIAAVSAELEEAEQRWCELQQELGEW